MINTNAELKPEPSDLRPKIIVIGVGGAGGNAVNNMIRSNLEGVSFVVANTDAQALQQSLVGPDHRVQLGAGITQGLGAGSKPEIGSAAAEESIEDIMSFINGTNMVFITAGMGGGTGTGAAPVIAKSAREAGILTVGVVTKPFAFEGSNRTKIAERGIEELQQYVDTLLIIPNQNLFRLANESTTFAEAFKMADNVLYSGVRGVTDLMIMPGLINLDFADIRAIMSEMGKAMMGTGEAEGERRALDAAEAAISNPLLDDVSLQGASGVLINITGGFDMTLYEVDEAANRIREEVEANANIIFGSTFDERLNGQMRVSVVATGIGGQTDMGAFKNIDMAAGFNSPLKNANAKMFENIQVADKQQQSQDNDSENYQEIDSYEEEIDFEPPHQKRPVSFFDRLRGRSSAPTSESRFDDLRYQKRPTPTQQMPRQTEIQQTPSRAGEEDEENYDIPSCFRRKK
jgi:cell division protein FtsZ